MTAANIVTGRSIHVALVVGDTAGHTHPALAVAEALQSRHPDTRVLFLGTSDSVAAGLVAKAGQPFVAIPGSPIRKANLAGLARAAGRGARAIGEARRLMVQHGIHVAMGFGGFASGGVLLGARSLGVPTAILEANVEFGLANRWLRPWVSRVFQGLGAPESDVVGVPVRSSVVALRDGLPRPEHRGLRVFVASGSRGAGFFAQRLPAVVEQLKSRSIEVEIWQQPVDSFVEDVAAAYAWADVVVARAGANTISELAIAGLPAVLVPLGDASANHQAANARLWQAAGAGVVITEADWHDADVTSWLHQMATNTHTRHQAGNAARRLARPDAAIQIAEACIAMAGSRV